ncbi:MAG: hypothetical protein ACI825_000699 [Planctomycetota bacterium]|jgi:hypothetical protein|uniref:hypothetical protein n=1 Tax=Patiriisocius sp. Uisw_047 TaxID=3230969 RepID=UPI0039EBA0AA
MEHKIFKKIAQSSNPDFGDIISKSFDMYKKVISEGILHMLISIAIVIPFMLIVYLPILPEYISMMQNMGDSYNQANVFEDMAPPFLIVWVLVILVMSFVMQVLSVSIFGHFLKFLKNKDLGNNDDIGGYFTIAKEHFGKIIVLSLATTGITLLATIACFLPVFYVMVPLTLITPIFIFNPELSVADMVKASFKLGNKYWGVLFGLFIVSGLMASLGFVACYIGIITTAFFSYIVYYYVYKETIGFDTD